MEHHREEHVATSRKAPTERAALQPTQQIFIVGSSRSGTTMMGRVLGRHPAVFTFHELHFFEGLWEPDSDTAPADPRKPGGQGSPPLDRPAAVRLVKRLLVRQRRGYVSRVGLDSQSELQTEAEALVDDLGTERRTPIGWYRAFLASETLRENRSIACDQTPRNIFHLSHILEHFPGARVLILLRAPAAVMLSQKYKWRRRSLGAGSLRRREVIRSWLNYHPSVVARLWRAAAREAIRFEAHPRVQIAKFEDLVANPEREIRRLCRGLGVEFEPAMLEVPRMGSSLRVDEPERVGIDAGRGLPPAPLGLGRSEELLGQRVTEAEMRRLGYPLSPGTPSWPARLGYGVLLPLKLAPALLLNLGRVRRLGPALARRWR